MASSESELLAKVKFPLYCLTVLTDKHVLVAGGGGGSNTGVKNGAEILALSHNGVHSRAELVKEIDTGKDAVMNCVSFPGGNCTILAAGAEGQTQIFSLKRRWRKFVDGEVISPMRKEPLFFHAAVRRRRSSSVSSGTSASPKTKPIPEENGVVGEEGEEDEVKKPPPPTAPKKPDAEDSVDYDAECVQVFQTDFGAPDSYQKVVRVHVPSSLLFTGGVDGYVRIWNADSFEKVREIEVGVKEVDGKKVAREIDDIAVSNDRSHFVCILRDSVAPVYKVIDGTKVADVTFTHKENAKYLFKRARFNDKALFALANPVGKPKLPGYIVKFGYPGYNQAIARKSNETLSALAVSQDGVFVAVGTMFTGSVEIYVAFSLQILKRVEGTHRSFITGLEFFPGFSKVHEASVMSISVDNHLQIHHVPRRREVGLLPVLIVGVALLIAVFCGCSYVDGYLTQ